MFLVLIKLDHADIKVIIMIVTICIAIVSICNQELRCLFQLLIRGEDDPGTGRENCKKNEGEDNDIDKGGSIAVMILRAMSR